MNRWFRVYDELLDDPKVQSLPPEDFRGWVNLLCLANRNGGRLPSIDAVAFALRIDNIAARSLVDRLATAGLIDTVKGGANGSAIAPHGWSKRQYKSDGSTERVKRFRERSKPVSETPDVTPPEAEADTDIPLDKSNGAEPSSDKQFWDGAKAFIGKPSLVGKWVRDQGKSETARAITAAQIERAVDPVAYVEGYFRKHRQGSEGLSVPC